MTKVLIVDDDAVDRMLMKQAISRAVEHVEILESESGSDAVERFLELLPDATLLDVRMPGMDGFQVLAHIRSLDGHRGHPVVMVSGSEERADLTRAHADGATAYYAKPDSIGGYVSLARRICSTWLPRGAQQT